MPLGARKRLSASTRGRIGPVTPDGLYQVTAHSFVAAFVIEHGRVVACAPILRRRFVYWQQIAVRIGD